MDNKSLLEKIYDKLERLVEEVNQLNIITARQEVHLEEHMKRSDLLEKEVHLLEERIVPLEDHIKFSTKLLKLISFGVGLTSVIVSVAELIRLFK
jgi:predicted nuclease with TOPRIM domain